MAQEIDETLTAAGSIRRPTIEQLLEYNAKAHRMLQTVTLRDRNWENNKREKIIFVDSLNREVDARPIRDPRCLRVLTQRGNDPFFPNGPYLIKPLPLQSNRPYDMQSPPYSLTVAELKVVLGYDYDYTDTRHHGNEIIHMNVMWQAIEECPTSAANAYVLGVPHHLPVDRSQEIMIPVQYYRISPRRHKALGISQRYLKFLWDEIKEEREREDGEK